MVDAPLRRAKGGRSSSSLSPFDLGSDTNAYGTQKEK